MSRPTAALHAQTTWLFAFGAVAVGIGVGFLTRNLDPKISAGIYAAIVGLAGFGSTYLTRARVGHAVVAFLVAAIACAGLYYLVVSSVMRDATVIMTDAVSGGAAHAEGARAGATFGKMFGVFAAAVAFLETLVGGILGAVAGAKLRAEHQAGSAGGLARAA